METKVCSKCGIKKAVSEFHKSKGGRFGVNSVCGRCAAIRYKEYRRSKRGVIITIFHHQCEHSKLRNHPPPAYSTPELISWAMALKSFHDVFDNWIASGYEKLLRPSFDRKDDYKPYVLSNLQVVTWDENQQRGWDDRKAGINNKISKSVLQYTLSGELVAEHCSIWGASRKTGVQAQNISKVCVGERLVAGGFVWKHKNKKK